MTLLNAKNLKAVIGKDNIDGVTRVKTGAIRLLELQEDGYAYMRP